jgi:enoyl-CoA hydratase
VSRHVRVEDRDGIALVRIDRPPANAMDLELLDEGHAVLDELARAEPGAVVLIGRDGFFSAGLDLKVAPTLDADGQRAMGAGINRLFAGWYGFPRPVVCAVNGHAIAGGLILALCADHRVCATDGSFGLTELRAGVPYPSVAMAVVRAELSPPAVRRLVLGAELIDPERALAWDVVDELAAPNDVLERALSVAAERAALPSRTFAAIKRELRGAVLEAALAEEGPADPLDPEAARSILSE